MFWFDKMQVNQGTDPEKDHRYREHAERMSVQGRGEISMEQVADRVSQAATGTIPESQKFKYTE